MLALRKADSMADRAVLLFTATVAGNPQARSSSSTAPQYGPRSKSSAGAKSEKSMSSLKRSRPYSTRSAVPP